MSGAWVVRAVAAMLAGIAFTSGLVSLARRPDTEHSKLATHYRVAEYPSNTSFPQLRFLMTAVTLNPVERRLQATLAFVPDSEDLKYVDAGGRSVMESGRLRPEFADAKVEIRLRNGELEETTISYPLDHLVLGFSSRPDGREVNFSISADVDPSQFPNDSYNFDLYMSADLPSGIAAVTPPTGSDSAASLEKSAPVPVVFGLALDERLGQWDLVTDRAVADTQGFVIFSNGYAYSPPVVRAKFERGWTFWAFIYAVSLMPAVIGLSFFIRTRRRRGATDASAAMELAAALLALIALRQVFVPTDIVALTRLDFLLGVQLLVVCWLMAVTYVAEPRPARQKPKPRVRKRRLIPKLPDGAVKR